MSQGQRIGVLVDGAPGSREPAAHAGRAILAALAAKGHEPTVIFVDRDLDLVLRQHHIDAAFLALTGRFGAGGCVQGLLEILGVPYTGSGVLAAALARDHARTRDLLRLHNLPTAPGYVFRALADGNILHRHGSFGFPVTVKPVSAGRGMGEAIAMNEIDLEAAVQDALRFDDEVIVQRYSEGRPVSVAVLDGLALGADHHGRPRLQAARLRPILRMATLAYEALGARGAACVELSVSDRGNETITAFDAAPALAPAGCFARIAQGAGLAFDDLIEEILRTARTRTQRFRANRRLTQTEFPGPDRRTMAAMVQH